MRELDELEANNTKRIVLGLVGLVAVAAGIGLLFRAKGKGAPEEDQKILIIEDRIVGLGSWTADLGFEPMTGDFAAWQSELAEQDGKKDAAEFGLPDILEFADRYGYGYVVIETPQRFADEIAELDLDEDGADSVGESQFAVISIGDFARPHQLGVDPPASSIQLDVGRQLLRTLFAHPRLSQTMDKGAAPSDIQAARLKLDKAIRMVEQIAVNEQRAVEMVSELETELGGFVNLQDAAKKARVLHEPLAGATAYALQDGRVIVDSDPLGFSIETSGLALRSSPEYWLRVIPAGMSASADAAVDCPEFLGGHGLRYELRRMELSAERDAMFVLGRGDIGTLFVFDVAAGPCKLREAGKLALPSSDNTFVAVSRRAIAMRHVDDVGQLHLDVQELNASPISITIDAGIDSSSSLVWLDERRLANLATLVDGQAIVVVVDLDRSDAPLLLPLRPPQAEGQVWAHELARIPGSDRALVLRWSIDDRYSLSRLDFDRPWAELIDEESPPGPESITWTRVTEVDSHMRGFDIDLKGRAVAFTYEGDNGVDVAVAPIPSAGGEARERVVILDDAYEHREVVFRPANDELLFRTRIRLEKPEGTLLTVHAIEVNVGEP